MKKFIVMAVVLAFCLAGSVQAQTPTKPKSPAGTTEPKEKPKRVKKVSAAEKKEAERKLEKFMDRMDAIQDRQVFGR